MTTKNSTLIANYEASPIVMNDAALLSGSVRIAQGNIALAAGDTGNADIVMLAPIPSQAVVTSIQVGSDALGGSCTYDIGIYTSAGAVKDIDIFATSVADGAAIAELRYEALGLETTGQRLHVQAGDTVDDMAFMIQYVVN